MSIDTKTAPSRSCLSSVGLAERLAIASVVCLGAIASLGILGGLLDVRSVSFLSAVAVVATGITCGLVTTRGSQRAGVDDVDVGRSVVIVPMVFLLSAARWLIRPAGTRLSWLVDTWDGTTNPGVVSYSVVSGNIGRDTTVLSQWETYPRAPHFAVAQLARIAEGFGFGSATDRATIYAIGLWFTYAVMLLAVGVVAMKLSYALGVPSRLAIVGAVVAQSMLMLAGNLEKTLLLHSLSFIACIACCVSLVAVWISLDHATQISPRHLLVLSLHIVVVVETYPLMLPFVVVVLGLLVHRHRGRIPLHSVGAVTAFALPLAIAAPRLLGQAQNSVTENQVSGGGHLLFLSSFAVLVVVVVSTVAVGILATSHRPGRGAALVLAGAIAVPVAAWLLVGNFDRTYGANYYPKKAELFVLVVVAAVVPAALLKALSRLITRMGPASMAVTMVVVVLMATWNGPLSLPRLIESSSQSRRYVDIALHEADNPSEVVIFGSNVTMSTYTSMLANLLDKNYWSVGYANDRLLRMFQQISVAKKETPPQELCKMVSRRPAELVIVDSKSTKRISCDSLDSSQP